MYTLKDFFKGDRVELHPATDRWVMGDRYGTVVKVGYSHLTVQLDCSGRSIRVHPENIGEITGKAWPVR